MSKTLEELYELQKQLDARIIKEKHLEGVDLLPNTVLALQVEICELANEWRGFKHWSNDREQRTCVVVKDPLGQCEGYTKNPLLEEYADCLSFFLQIARLLDLPVDDLYVAEDVLEYDTSIVFTELLHNVGMINGEAFLVNKPKLSKKERFRGTLYIFYALGEQRLGFTFEQIVEAYLAKHEINRKRQDNGY